MSHEMQIVYQTPVTSPAAVGTNIKTQQNMNKFVALDDNLNMGNKMNLNPRDSVLSTRSVGSVGSQGLPSVGPKMSVAHSFNEIMQLGDFNLPDGVPMSKINQGFKNYKQITDSLAAGVCMFMCVCVCVFHLFYGCFLLFFVLYVCIFLFWVYNVLCNKKIKIYGLY